ncbi:hypothetical protein ONZ45_g8191 [Pleurotus djamor]|nr:hypothetical protein ONZ45_g8191 [Pleurotus djamor]
MSRSNEDWKKAVESHIHLVRNSGAPIVKTTFTSTNPDTDFAQYIDHTLLKSDASSSQLDQLCDEAIRYQFKSCCVNGVNIPRVSKRLEGSRCIACAVVGFPLGASKSSVKAFETKEAIQDGAQEIDMVLNVGALKEGNYRLVHDDIKAVVDAANDITVKVILETVFLTDDEKIAACFLAAEGGAGFVKTCTGFCGGGANVADVTLMKRSVAYKSGGVKVKASAGIRSFETCVELIEAGAERLGTSSGASIMARSEVGKVGY